MPSSSSSASIPFIPTTYTFLCFGSCSTEEMYTADAYAEPKISSYTRARGRYAGAVDAG